MEHYELSNHLDNVFVTLSDRRLGQSTTDKAEYYTGEIQSATDYYPFGFTMPDREMSKEKSRFGFNGKGKDQSGEFGDLSHYDYGLRIYYPAIGKFLSVDPLTKSYPELTPYQFASNKPIMSIDLDGLESKVVVHLIGKDSKGELKLLNTVELTEENYYHASVDSFKEYSNQDIFGKRGTLTIYKNIDYNPDQEDSESNSPSAGKFEISLWDRLQNAFDEGSSTPELVGSGIHFRLSFGQGKENRFSPNSTIGENLDDLLGVAGRVKSLTSVPAVGVGTKATKAIPEIIDVANGTATNTVNLVEKFSKKPIKFGTDTSADGTVERIYAPNGSGPGNPTITIERPIEKKKTKDE